MNSGLYTNEAIAAFAIKDPKTLDSNYLYYALKSANLLGLNQAAMGKTLNSKSLAAIEIPLPNDINDQKRIAHVLGKVESLINERKQNIQQLDDLLKSVFLDMFGDPVGNDKGWDTAELETLCEKVIDCPHSTPKYSDEKTSYYCVRSSDIANGYLNLENTYNVDEETYQDRIKRHTPEIGDIVYSREGGRLGNAARILGTEKICLGQRIMLFKVNHANEPDFIWALLESVSFKNKITSLIGGGAAPRINIKDLKKLIVIKPDKNIQEEFSLIAKKIDTVKTEYQQSLTDLEILYGSLSQKAFKGELDLSKVPLPDESEENPDDMSSEDQNNMTENNKENSILGFSQFNPESIKDDDFRKTQLSQWFTEWLEHYQQESDLNINHFWQCIEFTTQDYVDENDEPLKIEVSDYDHIKDEIFAAIKSGVIKQTTNMIETVVDGKTQLEPGNQILLKKQH